MARKNEKALVCTVCGEPRYHDRTQRHALCLPHLREYQNRKKVEYRRRKGVVAVRVLRERQEARRQAEARVQLLYVLEQGLYALRRVVCLRDEGCLWESYKARAWSQQTFSRRYANEAAFRTRQRIRIMARKHGNPERQAEIEPASRWPQIAAAADGSITANLISKMLREAESCPLCEHRFDWSVRWRVPSIDHKTPISRGGLHSSSNIQVVCLSCNMAKGSRTAEEYASRARRKAA